MSIGLLFTLSVRNILRHKRRNGMLLAAIIVAVSMVCLTNTFIRGYQVDMLDAAINNLTGHVKVLAPGYRDDPSMQKAFALLEDYQPDLPADQVLGWAPRIRVPAVVVSERETRGVQLVGVNPAAEHISFLGQVEINGAALRGADDRRILLGRELARQLETELGRRVVVMAQGADGLNREQGFRIAGIYDAQGTALEKAFVFSGLEHIQQMLGSTEVTEMSVRLREELYRSQAKSQLAAAFDELEVKDWQELEPQMATLYLFADSAILIWFLLMMSALTFGLVNTLVTAVMERMRELGMLRALGMGRGMVIAQVVVESSLIMLMGVVLGVCTGLAAYWWLADGIDLSAFAAGAELAGMSTQMVPVLQWGDVVLVSWLSVLLGVLASLYPAWRVVKTKPLDALHG